MMNEVTYPVWMHKIIDGENPQYNEKVVNTMFVAPTPKDDRVFSSDDENSYFNEPLPPSPQSPVPLPEGRCIGQVLRLNNGYGFLNTDQTSKNLFFFWDDLEGVDFNDLAVGDLLEFEFGTNERGECARHITRPGGYPAEKQEPEPTESL